MRGICKRNALETLYIGIKWCAIKNKHILIRKVRAYLTKSFVDLIVYILLQMIF